MKTEWIIKTTQHEIPFDKLHDMLWGPDNVYLQFLERNRDRVFYNYPYPGNPGDSLIRMGTQLLLEDRGIRTTQDITTADICLFAGGCPTMWPDVMKLIETYLNSSCPGQLVIGPATFEFGLTPWPGLFRQFKDRIAGLFTRDWKSYQNLCSADLPGTIVKGVSHDPVFYLLGTSWHTQQRQNLSEDYILVSLRRDHEMKPGLEERILGPIIAMATRRRARKLTRWARNRSKTQILSRIMRCEKDKNLSIRDVDIWLLDTEAYLETIRKASRIYTDRLHVMIVASMLGKKVYAFSTLYGKLEHVYQTSMLEWSDVIFWK
jgi:exopolysaccharide biosynthesis predicted pyruvyltransferase EpsI